jgi:hypothetical protein
MAQNREITLAELADRIRQHNAAHPAETIKFVHGSTSAAFAFMGKEIITPAGERTAIAKAFIPTGQLRKRYGVYPVSGELAMGAFGVGGVRKVGINHSAISGMVADEEGLGVALNYAQNFTGRMVDVKKIHKNIEQLISEFTPENFIVHLKLLAMQITNVLLIDPEAHQKADVYLQRINNEYNAICKSLQQAGRLNDEFHRRFRKYFVELAEKLKQKRFVLKAEDKFREQVTKQFPIIICSTVQPRSFGRGVYHEKVYFGDIPAETIKIVFTPFDHVETLKERLAEGGMDYIQVVGFQPAPREIARSQLDQALLDEILHATTPDALGSAIAKITETGYARDRYLDALIHELLKNYIEDGKEERFQLLIWFFKNIQESEEHEVYFNTEAALYERLKRKVDVSPKYLSRLGDKKILDQFERMSVIPYIHALAKVTQLFYFQGERVPGIDSDFLDYTKPFSSQFDSELQKFTNNQNNASDSLRRLCYLYLVLSYENDLESSENKKNNIIKRMQEVKKLILINTENYLRNNESRYDDDRHIDTVLSGMFFVKKIIDQADIFSDIQEKCKTYFGGVQLNKNQRNTLDKLLAPTHRSTKMFESFSLLTKKFDSPLATMTPEQAHMSEEKEKQAAVQLATYKTMIKTLSLEQKEEEALPVVPETKLPTEPKIDPRLHFAFNPPPAELPPQLKPDSIPKVSPGFLQSIVGFAKQYPVVTGVISSLCVLGISIAVAAAIFGTAGLAIPIVTVGAFISFGSLDALGASILGGILIPAVVLGVGALCGKLASLISCCKPTIDLGHKPIDMPFMPVKLPLTLQEKVTAAQSKPLHFFAPGEHDLNPALQSEKKMMRAKKAFGI